MPRVAIIGTGLIGASIGLRLRADGSIRDLEVAGYDRESNHTKRAQQMGALDVVARSAREAVSEASLVILRRLMGDITPELMEGAVVTDTGSTKADVMSWAERELPRTVSFVGGHPMAGKTESGPEAADAALFQDARWVIIPGSQASESAVKTVRSIVEIMGATPMFMDAQEHDAYAAAISHLPMMAASAMFTVAHESEAWPELSMLAAGGFKSATRMLDTEPDISFDIVATNRTQIVHWIERYREALLDLQERILDENGEEELFRYMAQANWDYTTFMTGPVGRTEQTSAELPSMDLTGMLMGEAAAQKLRDLTASSDERLSDIERDRRLTRRDD
jgi:prephenate dehydrogenase